MTPFTDLTGLAGSALAIAAGCLLLPGTARLRPAQKRGLFLAVFAAVLLPLQGLPLAAYVRGAAGDLSVASVLMLAGAAWRRLGGLQQSERSHAAWPPAGGGRVILLWLIVAGGLVLYPMALGWGSFDSYRLGYGDPWFLSILLAMALAGAVRRAWEASLVIALAVLGWDAGWYESTNLWDCLIDPWAFLYAFAAVLRRGIPGWGRPRAQVHDGPGS